MRFRDLFKFLFGPVVFLLLFLVPPLPMVYDASLIVGASMLKAPQIALGGMIWIASWWIFEVVPLGVASLLSPLIFSLLGFVSWQDSLTSFMDSIIWVFMGGFALARAFQVWGLDRRIAFKVSTIYKGENPIFSAFFIACLPAFLLTVTGSITASTTIVYPIVVAYLSSMGFVRGSSFAEATMLSLAQASTAGAMLFLISTPPNLIAKRVIENSIPGVTLTFLDWFIVGGIHAIIGLIVSWILAFKLIGVSSVEVKFDYKLIEERVKSLEPMSRGEKLVLMVFFITISLWLFPGIFIILSNIYPQLSFIAESFKNLIPEAFPAVLAIFLLCFIKVDDRSLLTWDDFETGIDWNVVFLFGGGISMSKALIGSGFSEWVALLMSNFSSNWIGNIWVISALSALLAFIITYPASNTAAALIACPLAVSLAKSVGVNPMAAVISAALASSISSALPSTTPPMAIVYGSGYVKLWNMFKVGMISDIIRLILLIVLEPYLVNILLFLKGLV
ncbi:MAG: DASS family sodium-coupled anion symporter [Candidatus Methanomethylicia archaeon]